MNKDNNRFAAAGKKARQAYNKVAHSTRRMLRRADEASGTSLFVKRTRKPNFILSILINAIRIVLVCALLMGMCGLGAVIGLVKAYVETAPVLETDTLENRAQTSFIYDANGEVITSLRSSENRIWATYEEIPEQLINAFVAIEDSRFFSHNGVDAKRLLGAFVNNMQNNSTQGGSTITQQLIKLSVLSPERTYKRKIQEAYLAMELEKTYDKTQILESYLNTIHLGDSNYGVRAAALDFFGKDLDRLTLRECAALAGLTRNPYAYNPRKNYFQRDQKDVTDDRTDTVLMRMYHCGFINQQQYHDALEDELDVVEFSEHNALYEYPHFVEYAVYDVITFMLQQRGLEDNSQNRSEMESELRTGGYHIYTTIDPTIQKTLENTIYFWDNYPSTENAADNQVISYNSDGSTTAIIQPQVSAVIIDQHSGQIKGMVGSRTPPEVMKSLNRCYQSTMPVGSSIKPLSIYAPALDAGAGASSIIYNVDLPIPGWDTAKGYPSSAGSSAGPVTMRYGVIKSLNIVAARTLQEWVGIDNSVAYLTRMGTKEDHIAATPSGMALGSSGLTMIELAAGYATLANMGVYQQPVSFTTVKDSDGNVVIDAAAERVTMEVYKPSTAWMMTDILTDAVQSGTGTRAQIPGMTVAGKTGTNQDSRGVTFAGYTPYYTAAVWIGHDNYKALSSDSGGGRSAAPLWQAIMEKIHANLADKEILDATPESVGLIQATICSISGKRATAACSGHTVTDWFLAGDVPTESCDMHVSSSVCSVSGMPVGPYCPKDAIKHGAHIRVPGDHVLAQLGQSELSRILPGAVIEGHSGTGGTCTYHTKEWANQQAKFQSNAKALIKQAAKESTALLITNPVYAAQLASAAGQLQALIKDPKAKTEDIQKAYDNLKELLAGIPSTPDAPTEPTEPEDPAAPTPKPDNRH